jgi:hypothetical protein
LADLLRGFAATSSTVAHLGFFVNDIARPWATRLEKLCFTGLSSSEWKLMIPARPPGAITAGNDSRSF